jgi:peptidoglycan hydrolase CwlO-like protein
MSDQLSLVVIDQKLKGVEEVVGTIQTKVFEMSGTVGGLDVGVKENQEAIGAVKTKVEENQASIVAIESKVDQNQETIGEIKVMAPLKADVENLKKRMLERETALTRWVVTTLITTVGVVAAGVGAVVQVLQAAGGS